MPFFAEPVTVQHKPSEGAGHIPETWVRFVCGHGLGEAGDRLCTVRPGVKGCGIVPALERILPGYRAAVLNLRERGHQGSRKRAGTNVGLCLRPARFGMDPHPPTPDLLSALWEAADEVGEVASVPGPGGK